MLGSTNKTMISVYIESPDEIIRHRIRYVMTQMLVAMGFQHTFFSKRDEINDGFSIACVPRNSDLSESLKKFDLIVPYGSYASWTERCPDIRSEKIDGINVLYIDEFPKFLINERLLGFDLINIVFYLLSRQEEYTYEHRDPKGGFSPTYSTLYENGVLQIPLINYYIKHIENHIVNSSRITPEPKWKDNSHYAVVLSHDVDVLPFRDITVPLYQIINAFSLRGFIAKLSLMKNSLMDMLLSPSSITDWQLSYWLDKEKEYNLYSTFFVAGNTINRQRSDPSYWLSSKVIHNGQEWRLSDVVKSFEDMGWEIGLHGSYNSYQDENLLGKERDLLIKQTGCKIIGVRHHCLRFDVRKTWSVHENLGFTYDTTLGYNEINGFRAGIAFPFTPYDIYNGCEYNLLELPMSIMDGSFFCDYGEKLDAQKAIIRCEKITNAVKETGGMLVVNFHPNFCATTHADSWKLYEYILKHATESGAWVTNGKEIANWWIKRRNQLTK